MEDTAKSILRASLYFRAFIVAVAVYNCIVVWMASDPPGVCWVCPWYQHWSFTNVPTRLLAAACLLLVGRAWGYSAAIALCGFILAEAMPWYANSYRRGLLLFSLSELWEGSPFLSLHVQYLLASIILVYAAVAWGRSAHRRGESLR